MNLLLSFCNLDALGHVRGSSLRICATSGGGVGAGAGSMMGTRPGTVGGQGGGGGGLKFKGTPRR